MKYTISIKRLAEIFNGAIMAMAWWNILWVWKIIVTYLVGK